MRNGQKVEIPYSLLKQIGRTLRRVSRTMDHHLTLLPLDETDVILRRKKKASKPRTKSPAPRRRPESVEDRLTQH